MKNFTMGLALIFGGALMLGTACGDDGDEGDEAGAGTGGSTSKGGSGGTAGTAGSTSKGGGTGKGGSGSAGEPNNGGGGEPNNGGGGEPNNGGGGEPNNGLGGAFTGFGGAANNPDQCPGAAPADMDACDPETEGGAACTYGGTSCFCVGQGQGGGGAPGTGEWNCIDFGGADCPQDEPTPGDDCEGLIVGCSYGNTQCFCPSFGQDQDTWVCN